MDAFLVKAVILVDNLEVNHATMMVTSEFGKTESFAEYMEKVLVLEGRSNTKDDAPNVRVDISANAHKELVKTLK